MKRLTWAGLCFLLAFGIYLFFRIGPSRSTAPEPPQAFRLTITNVPAHATHIPYGEEFWRGAAKQSTSRSSRFAALPFDINEVVDRASHEWAPGTNHGFSVTSRTYIAKANSNGLSIAMRQRKDVGATFITRAIIRGGHVLQLHDAAFESAQNVVQREIADGLIEHVDARRNGISLTWILNHRIVGSGPLQIATDVRDLAFAGTTEHGQHFADARGQGFCIGNVTAVDRAGHRWPIKSQAGEAGIEILVPETILNEADYPLAIDPLINPEFGVDAPVRSLSPDFQQAPSIAYANGVYLVGWVDLDRSILTTRPRLARFDWRGHPLGPDPISIGAFAFPAASLVQIASNGSDFLILSQEGNLPQCRVTLADSLLLSSKSFELPDFPAAIASTGGNPRAGYLAISLVNSNGYRFIARPLHPHDDNPIGTPVESLVGVTAGPLSLASDGTNYLAVWSNGGIFGMRFSEDGKPLDPAPFRIGGGDASDLDPKVTYAQGFPDGAYAVSWLRGSDPNATEVLCQRIDRNGNVLDANPILLAGPGNKSEVICTPHGLGFLVAWHSADYTNYKFEIQAARLPISGPLEAPFTVLSQNYYHVQSLHAAPAQPAAYHTFLLWSGYTAESSADVAGRFIPYDREMEPVQIVAAGPNVESSPAAAFGDSGYLVVWQDNRNSVTNEDDIFGIYVDENGRPKGPSAFPIATGFTDQSSPSVAAAHDRYLVAWRENLTRYGSFDDVKGALLSNQTILRSLDLGVATNSQRGVALASDGTNFLAVWRDDRVLTDTDIYGIHVTHDGDLVGPSDGFIICNVTNEQAAPVVASNGTNYLVVWRDSRNVDLGARDDIYGAIIQPLSSVLPESIAISAIVPEDQHAPDVASNGKDYFVVWRDERTDNAAIKTEIWGTAVSASGVVASPFGIPLVPPAAHQREPAISRFGNDYLLAWLEKNDPSPDEPNPSYHTFTRRILSDGSVDGTVTKVSATGKDQGVLALASSQPTRALILSETESLTNSRVVVAQTCLSNCPVVLSFATQNGSPAIVWNAEANHHYRLQFTINLVNPDWRDAQDATPVAQGFAILPDSNGFAETTRFYRIVRLP